MTFVTLWATNVGGGCSSWRALDASLAEEILFARAAQGGGPGSVLRTDVSAEAADDRRRYPARLVADEIGRRGRLVGDRDQGCLQLPAGGVAAAAPVVEWRQAGAADRH